jgi:hypothetical protein
MGQVKTAPPTHSSYTRNGHNSKEKGRKIMGIHNSAIRLLMREGNREKFSGRILQLGNQEVLTTEESLKKIAQEENFKLLEAHSDIGYGRSKYGVHATTISSKYFFQRLGFETVDSLDFSSYEGANIIHDLNVLLDKDFKNIDCTITQ